ncbi:hypothetical protein MBLNU459_g8509t1 [Dothideomycetes sp. NU459]
MSSSAVTHKSAQQQQVSKPAQHGQLAREEREASAKASASAGLNLNVFGAISGAFSGKSKKEQQADGSSKEQREEAAHIRGVGMGNAQAVGAANAEAKSREMREQIMAGES